MSRGEAQPGKVLIVRPDRIGDFVLWLDSAKRLRDLFPTSRYRITLLANRLWAPLARALPYFDEVWELDRRRFVTNPFYRLSILRRVARAGFSDLIDPLIDRDFFRGDAIARASGATRRIAYAANSYQMTPLARFLGDRWHTQLVGDHQEAPMQLRRNAEFLRALGLADCRAGMPRLEPEEPVPSSLDCVDFYVICPGASQPIKRWPVRNFAEVARRIFERTGWTGIVCGSPSEAGLARELRAAARCPLQDFTGGTSIASLVSIISKARMLIGSDAGPVHIAAAVGTPAVCVLGGGQYRRFLPYETETGSRDYFPEAVIHRMDCFGCNWHCIYRPSRKQPAPCIRNVSVDDVWRATEAVLSRVTGDPATVSA